MLVRLQAANAPSQPRRQQLDLLPHSERAVEQRARHDGAEARHDEAAVNGEARAAEVLAPHGLHEHVVDERRELGQPLSRDRRDEAHRRPVEGGAPQRLRNLVAHEVRPLLVDGVRLGQHDDPALHLQQVEDGEVLPRLRHHGLVRRDNQHGKVNPAHAREHVLDEALVARHVDDADLAAAGQGEPGKSQLNSHLPVLLLLEPVRVDARERLDQRRLAMVNVARSANDEHAPSFARVRSG